MGVNDILILRSAEIQEILRGREREVIEEVRLAYLAHGARQTFLPHSSFLTFPGQPADRIIALPAYLGGNPPASGLKWISSFPANTSKGMDRASAVLVLNSLVTGRAEAIMEGSGISAQRTAASAALAAQALHSRPAPDSMGLVGCGLINYEIARFTKLVFPGLKKLALLDRVPGKAESAAVLYETMFPEVTVIDRMDLLFKSCEIIAFATTAATPHVTGLVARRSGCTILNVSLRDLSPEIILAADNVVDDPDHVCRASTSLHLAEQKTGNRAFIRCSLSDILDGTQPARGSEEQTLIFSPFGLGILDLAVARLVMRVAREKQQGIRITDFHPHPQKEANSQGLSETARHETSV
jgi:2,3-diaminopropionate biosynthesis protein SbnB